ncbi:protein kinase, partial [Micromonospora zhanjiangensis]
MAGPLLLDGRYRVGDPLGSGGMARVWRGRDLRLDRPVAVKKLSGGGLSQAYARERFDQEARAIARLSHPNIVSVYDFGSEDDEPYLIMELVEGPTVARRLADGDPLPVADAVAIAVQVCDGLAAAHAAGIVHRDVKPANLIISPSGLVKICDFGVARLLDATGHAELTMSGISMGSPQFMAPEQINHEEVGPRTDLYALGCTLYAMLTGNPPFHGAPPIGIMHQHVHKPPRPVRELRPQVPAEVADLVAELLAKAPEDRPADADTVRNRLVAADVDPAASAGTALRPSYAPVGFRPAGSTPAGPAVDGPVSDGAVHSGSFPTGSAPPERVPRGAALNAVSTGASRTAVVDPPDAPSAGG